MTRFVAIAFTVDGDERIFAESEEWEGEPTTDTDGTGNSARQRRALIARLGVDGWEPVPLTYGEYGHIHWFLKRQSPNA